MRDPEFQEFERDFRGGSSQAYVLPKPDLWQRMSRVMEVFLYLLILAAILRLFWPEVEKQRSLNAELARVEKTRGEREAQAGELRQKYGLLKSDREYLEAVARDRLDLARPGEHVIRIERPEPGELPRAMKELPRVKPLEKADP